MWLLYWICFSLCPLEFNCCRQRLRPLARSERFSRLLHGLRQKYHGDDCIQFYDNVASILCPELSGYWVCLCWSGVWQHLLLLQFIANFTNQLSGIGQSMRNQMLVGHRHLWRILSYAGVRGLQGAFRVWRLGNSGCRGFKGLLSTWFYVDERSLFVQRRPDDDHGRLSSNLSHKRLQHCRSHQLQYLLLQ